MGIDRVIRMLKCCGLAKLYKVTLISSCASNERAIALVLSLILILSSIGDILSFFKLNGFIIIELFKSFVDWDVELVVVGLYIDILVNANFSFLSTLIYIV